MKVTKKHPITGKYNTLELDVTDEQCRAWEEGTLIQEAMPNLSPEEREFLISGLLPGEYDEMFKEEENG